MGRQVDAPRLDAPAAQLLDEHAQRAAGVERDLGIPARHHLVGDVAEETRPVAAALVRAALVVAVVALVVEQRALRRQRGRGGRAHRLAPTFVIQLASSRTRPWYSGAAPGRTRNSNAWSQTSYWWASDQSVIAVVTRYEPG